MRYFVMDESGEPPACSLKIETFVDLISQGNVSLAPGCNGLPRKRITGRIYSAPMLWVFNAARSDILGPHGRHICRAVARKLGQAKEREERLVSCLL